MRVSSGSIGIAFLVAAALWGCRETSAPGPAEDRARSRDTIPPNVSVTLGVGEDGLLALQIRWGAGSKVSLAGVQVHARMGLSNSAENGTDLMRLWRLGTSAGGDLDLHETPEHLSVGGAVEFWVSVTDNNGNTRLDSVGGVAPWMAFIKTIPSGIQDGYTQGVTICPDDHRVYMTVDNRLFIVDGDNLTPIALVPMDSTPGTFQTVLYHPLCATGDSILYVTARGIARFNRYRRVWLPTIPGYWTSVATESRADPALLYVAEECATVAAYDRVNLTRRGTVLTSPLEWPCSPGGPLNNAGQFMTGVAALPGDQKLYVGVPGGGVVAVDPRLGSVLKVLWNGGTPDILPGDTLLGAAGNGHFRLFDTRLDARWQDILTLPEGGPRAWAASADGRRVFLTGETGGSDWGPSWHWLIDVPDGTVLQTIVRTALSGWVDQAVAFHPNGHLVFVTHGADLDVYVQRR